MRLHEKQTNNTVLLNNPLETARAGNLIDRFVFVNNRRFIADLPSIIFPHDNLEATRKYKNHYIYKYIWRGLVTAPIRGSLISGNANCLDVACGSGIWAMEMGMEFPKSTFVGIDFGQGSPDDTMKPFNVGFLNGCNLSDGIPFPDNTFNYIHQRRLLYEFPFNPWVKVVVPEMIRVTKPLGWIEVDDISHKPQNMGPVNIEFNKAFRSLSAKLGFVDSSVSKVTEELSRAGLINVQSVVKQIPIGSWGGQIGELIFQDMKDTILSLKVVLQAQMGITEEEYFQKVQEFAKEVNTYKTYVAIYRVWGQRP